MNESERNKIVFAMTDLLKNDNNSDDIKWLSRKAAAEQLNCSPRHFIRRYEKTGRLKNYNPGGWAQYLQTEINQIRRGER